MARTGGDRQRSHGLRVCAIGEQDRSALLPSGTGAYGGHDPANDRRSESSQQPRAAKDHDRRAPHERGQAGGKERQQQPGGGEETASAPGRFSLEELEDLCDLRGTGRGELLPGGGPAPGIVTVRLFRHLQLTGGLP